MSVSRLWEGVIAGAVMVVTWAVMTGGPLPAPLAPVFLNAAGAVGLALLLVCGFVLALRGRRSSG
jgi:hypothetical protein